MSVGSHRFGVVRLRTILQGTSKRTFDCQLKHLEVFTPRETYIANKIYRQSQQVLIASDMQILRQAVQLRISNCGGYECLSLGAVEEGTLLLLLSKNDNRYNNVKGGRSFKSNLLNKAFSLMPVGFVNDSSETKDGASLFSFA